MFQSKFLAGLCAALVCSVFSTFSASIHITPEEEAALLKDIRFPSGFEAKVFAKAPDVNYPVFVSAAPDGAVYVSSDRNGSLDRAPHRGRVLRVRDLDGDGHADEVKEFVKDVDSPRGLVWDHDRLYLMHPPHLSVYIDHDGDGVADEEKVLVKNIAFGFKDRPADHSSNGLELGVDGWIYCAIGDFGFMEAEGTDGRKLQLRGGGVVRVRPDGSGLELYSHGTRNILEVAVSPLLDAFARDNTNDGDGWDIRFHHFAGGSEHGYPSLFKNFKGEFIEPLADYGGGSGCGALFLSEPGFPGGFNDAVYTADWGREWIYRHRITPKGATYSIDQTEFVRAPRVTDLDVDALSHIYVSSWKGATFTYVGENVGFLARISPAGYKPEALPDFARLNERQLIHGLESPSHRRALEAQRELLRRGLTPASVNILKALAADGSKPMTARVAAVFALKQGLGARSAPVLKQLAGHPDIQAFAIRALADNLSELGNIPAPTIVSALQTPDPRTRREAAVAIGRLGDASHADSLAPLLNDADPIVAHVAVQSLKKLHAANTAFAIVDRSDASEIARARALQVLQSLHESSVVNGLIDRLQKEKDFARSRGLLTALCRLHSKDGIWKGDSWGTRPDTTGPYYQAAAWEESEHIANVLKAALQTGQPEQQAHLVREFARHKIHSADTLATVINMAMRDDTLLPAALVEISRADKPAAEALPLLARAGSADLSDVSRAHAAIALAKAGTPEAYEVLLALLPKLERAQGAQKETASAKDAFLNSRNLDEQQQFFETAALKLDGRSSAWADAALLKVAARKSGSPEAREAAARDLEKGWAEPKRRAQLLKAVALAGHREWRDKVLQSMDDSDPDVASAARQTANTLRLNRENRPRNTSTLIEKLPVADAIAMALKATGNAKTGEDLFTRQGCVNCHTVSADQPLRGPFLGNIATTYKRPELAEAILLPSKTIAQGFASHHFELKDGTEIDGFVTQEGAELVKVRTVTAQEIEIKTSQIAKRIKTEKSIMPEGLVANLTVQEFASLLEYLESLSRK